MEKSECEYNLLYEHWIQVLMKDFSVKSMSILDVLEHADEIQRLAGESEGQDLTIQRFLLSIIHTVFSRYDADGNFSPIDLESAPLRTKEIYDLGRFPMKPIRDYLKKYEDRFWLFHPTHPFMQVLYAKEHGTMYGAAKLCDDLHQSDNKERWYACRRPAEGEDRISISYDEAARSLIFIVSADDASVKKISGEGCTEKISQGHVGHLNNVYIEGSNLFETILLNSVFLRDGSEMFGEDRPIWETEPRTGERTQVPVPDNQAELLTLQNRRVFLFRENGRVTGFRMYGGDSIVPVNAFCEQLTTWTKQKDPAPSGEDQYTPSPKKKNLRKNGWRALGSLTVAKDGQKMPGVVQWVKLLIDLEILPENMPISIRTVAFDYTSMQAAISDEYSDDLTMHGVLLSKKGSVCLDLILTEIERCEKRAQYLGTEAAEIAKAEGLDQRQQDEKANFAKDEFFFEIDFPFKCWMNRFTPNLSDRERDRMRKEWSEKADSIASENAERLAMDAGRTAFIGRSDQKKGEHYSTAEALNNFYGKLRRLSGKEQNQ